MSDNPFYRTGAWVKTRNVVMARDNYLCQWCLQKGRLISAEVVHHIKTLDKYPELGLEVSNLVSLCHGCHNRHHGRLERRRRVEVKRERRARIIRG